MGAGGSTPAAVGATPRRVLGLAARPVGSVPVVVWLVGLVGALLVMGPALGPGSLLNLDLVVLSDPPVPAGMWGLGPELPRRVPLWGPLAWASWLAGGELVTKVLLVMLLVAAFAGAWRLTATLAGERGHRLGPWIAATFYAFGPFLATRTAVGHLMVPWVMALLPWAVASLLSPVSRRPAMVLWAAALGLCGVFGGVIAGAYVAVGVVRERSQWRHRPRRLVWSVALFLAVQLPWLVPLAVVGVAGTGRDLARASDFAPVLGSAADAARLVAGQGFWNTGFQIGQDLPWLSALAGLVLLASACLGWSRVPQGWRGPLGVVAAVALAVAVATAVPGLSSIVDDLSATVLGAPFRDSQRQLVPFLLLLAVAAGLGADRLATWRTSTPIAGSLVGIGAALPLAAAIVLAVPAAGGFGGQVRPVHLPGEWAQAKAAVAREPGTVLALPWFEYYTLDINRNRLTLGIVPSYFGGDVLAASDPRLTADRRREVADPRLDGVEAALERARQGEHVADALAAAGVRWIALQHDVDWKAYTGVLDDPGLERVVAGPSLDLYRVDGWRGPVAAADGSTTDATSVVSPLLRVDASGAAVLDRPYQAGWLRGWSAAARSADGLVELPAGSGPVWFWPALLVLAGDALALGAIGQSAYARWSGRREAQ